MKSCSRLVLWIETNVFDNNFNFPNASFNCMSKNSTPPSSYHLSVSLRLKTLRGISKACALNHKRRGEQNKAYVTE